MSSLLCSAERHSAYHGDFGERQIIDPLFCTLQRFLSSNIAYDFNPNTRSVTTGRWLLCIGIGYVISVSMWEINYQEAQLLLRMSRSYGIVWNSRAACLRWGFPDKEILVDRLFTVYFSFIRQLEPMSVVQEVETREYVGGSWKLKVEKSWS